MEKIKDRSHKFILNYSFKFKRCLIDSLIFQKRYPIMVKLRETDISVDL